MQLEEAIAAAGSHWSCFLGVSLSYVFFFPFFFSAGTSLVLRYCVVLVTYNACR